MTMKGKPFFALLEGMRGVAALLVVLRHIPHLVLPLDFPVSGLAVDIFFVLSGVVIANSYEERLQSGQTTFRAFFRARIVRIHPLYLLGCLVGLVSVILADSLAPWQLILAGGLALFMLPFPFSGPMTYPLDMPTWSLFFEFAANFAYALMIRHASSFRLAAIVAASWAILIAIGIKWQIPIEQLGWTRTTFLAGFARVACSFFFGVLIYRGTRDRLDQLVLGDGAAIAILAAMALILMFPVAQGWEWQFCAGAVVVALPALVVGAVFVRPGATIEHGLRLLGELSFPAYVLHVPIYQIIDVAIGHRTLPSAPWAGLAYLAALAIASVFINRFVDVPLRRAIQSSLRKRQAVPA